MTTDADLRRPDPRKPAGGAVPDDGTVGFGGFSTVMRTAGTVRMARQIAVDGKLSTERPAVFDEIESWQAWVDAGQPAEPEQWVPDSAWDACRWQHWDPGVVSIPAVAAHYGGLNAGLAAPAHFVVDPFSGAFAQLVPLVQQAFEQAKAAAAAAVVPIAEMTKVIAEALSSILPEPHIMPELPRLGDPPAVLHSKAAATLRARDVGGKGPQQKLRAPREVRR